MANKEVDIDYNVREIIDNLDKSKVFTKEDKKRIEESLNFDSVVEQIDITDNNNRVIFTDGEDQLIYEDGEFFVISSTDSLKIKKKKKRNEAREMYIEYFIKYQLNPILKQKELHQMARTISREEPKRQVKTVKKELNNKTKNIPDNESRTIKSRTKSIDSKDRQR